MGRLNTLSLVLPAEGLALLLFTFVASFHACKALLKEGNSEDRKALWRRRDEEPPIDESEANPSIHQPTKKRPTDLLVSHEF
jgi:hypothetical protein